MTYLAGRTNSDETYRRIKAKNNLVTSSQRQTENCATLSEATHQAKG
jgi:hypothetical protein